MPVEHALTGLAPLTFNDTLSHAYVAVNANSALAVYLEPQALQAGWSLQVRVRLNAHCVSAPALRRFAGRQPSAAGLFVSTTDRQGLTLP